MTSQSSTNKQNKISLWSLMREDLRHKTWMIALSVLGSFLAGPLLFLFILTTRYDDYIKIVGDKVYNLDGSFLMTLQQYHQQLLDSCTSYINNFLLASMLIIAFAGAMIVAFYGFQFLFSKRKVDLYHSAPVSRKKLFTAIWLNGFLIWFVPALCCELLVFVLAAFYMKGLFLTTILGSVMIGFLRILLCFLMVYNACLVGVMISGNYVNAMVNAITYGLLVFGLIGFLYILIYSFLDNVYYPAELIFGHPLYILSPLTTPIILLAHWIAKDRFIISESWHLFGGILVMIVNLKLAFELYLKRPSELSERGLEAKWAQVPFRACLSLMSGIAFCMFFFVTVGEDHLGWQIFGIFFGTTLAFCILNIIYHGTFKEILSHKIQYGIVLIAGVLLFFGMRFDVFGYSNRLPAKHQIVSMTLEVPRFQTQATYINALTEVPIVKKEGLSRERTYVTRDTESIYRLLKNCTTPDTEDVSWGYNTRIQVKVKTKFGSYYRSYNVAYKDLELLAPFVESEEYAKVFYPLESLQCELPDQIEIGNSYVRRGEAITDRSKIEALMQAFHQDFTEHRTISDLQKYSRYFRICLQYDLADRYNSSRTFDINIPYWYEHTIDLVKSWEPDKNWDPVIEDVVSLELNDAFYILKSSDPLKAFYQYWGYDASGSVSEAPYRRIDTATQEIAQVSISHHFTDEEIASLKVLEPYLIWGQYTDPNGYGYVNLGFAELKDGDRATLYIHYGKLPWDIVKTLGSKIKISSPYEYEDDIYYTDDSFYQ